MANPDSITTGGELTRVVIEPRRGWLPVNWKELWQHRELLWFLTWRDVKVRYKQTVLGALWAILQPFLKMVVLTFVFHGIAKVPSEEAYPYAIFLYAAMLPWQFFASSVRRSSESIVASANLIGKVYFPRLIIPLASVGAVLVDFALSFVVLAGIMIYYGMAPSAAALMVVPLTVATVFVAVGIGTFFSALNVAYRDFRYVVPFLVEIWFFLTPVVWSLRIVPERLQRLVGLQVMALNPMCGVVEAFRSALLPDRAVDWPALGVSLAVAACLFVVGLYFFRRIERQFADII